MEFIGEAESSIDVGNNNVFQQDFIAEAIASIERMESVARSSAQRLRDAIEDLETELASTEPPTTRRRIDPQNDNHQIELPSDGVEQAGLA